MYTIFIDSHSSDAVVIIYKDNIILDKIIDVSHRNHSNTLVPMIDEILHKNDILPEDLNEIIVVIGPGSFTGVRIGVTVAKTLAYTLNIPIKTITSLELKLMSTDSNNPIIVEDEKNGCYIGLYENRKLKKDFFYLEADEYQEYIRTNNLEDMIVDELDIDYSKLIAFCANKKVENPHAIKPLYVKKIEVLK